MNLSPITYHLSPITYHLSPITYHLSPITYHPKLCLIFMLMAMTIPVFSQVDPVDPTLECDDCQWRYHLSYPQNGKACAGITTVGGWSLGMQDDECGFRINFRVYRNGNQVYWGQSGSDLIIPDNNIENLAYFINQTGNYKIVIYCQKWSPCPPEDPPFTGGGSTPDYSGSQKSIEDPGKAALTEGWVNIGRCEYNFLIDEVSYPIPADLFATTNYNTAHLDSKEDKIGYVSGCEDIDYWYQHTGIGNYYNLCSYATICEHRWYFDHEGVRYYPFSGWQPDLPNASPPKITSMSTLITNLILQPGDEFTLNLEIRHDYCLTHEKITFKYLDPEEILPLHFLVDYGNANCPGDPTCIEDKYDIPGEASQTDGIHEIYSCAEPAPVGGRRTVPLHDLFFQWNISSWDVKVYETACVPNGLIVVEFAGNSSFHDITTTPISSYYVPGNPSQDFYFTMNPDNYWYVEISFTDHCSVERTFGGIFEVNFADRWGLKDDDSPPVSLIQNQTRNSSSFTSTNENFQAILSSVLSLEDIERGNIQIYNVVGDYVGQVTISDRQATSSPFLNTGIYFYTFSDDDSGSVASGKFLIK